VQAEEIDMPDFTIPPELIEHLNRGDCVLFIGADLPRAVTGLPSRSDLAREMAQRYHLDEALSLADVAQRVSQAGNRFEFTDFIRTALDTAGKSPSMFYQGIVTLVKEHAIGTIITTAYDNLLEVAFQQASLGFNRVVRGSDVSFIRPDRPTLIKLYGDAQQPDTLVVTDRDHSQLLRDRDKEDVIDEVRRAFKRNTILFYGYSLSDPDFKFLFDQIAESKFARLAYAIWPGLPEADVRMWRDRNIVILEEDPLGVLSNAAALSSSRTAESQVNLPAGSIKVVGHDTWLDVEIRLHDRSETGYKIEMTLNSEQTIGGVMSADAASFIPIGDPRDDGQRLFNTLFTDKDLREAWGEARGQSQQRRLRLRIDPLELRGLPWELLRDDDDILAATAHTPFSRYLATDQPWGGAIAARPIRILAVISNPTDLATKYELPPAAVPTETAALRAAVTGLGSQVQLDFLAAPITLERLEEHLRAGYHVLHFIGHGSFNAPKQQAALYLQNEDGTTKRVTDDEFVSLLKRLKSPPQLIVLAACQSAQQSLQDAFSGLGPRLVQIGTPAVVAMQDNVTMLTARKFSAKFYQRLLEHGTVDLALNEARSTLITNGRYDAAVPVLFMRLRDGQLLSVPNNAALSAGVAARPSPVVAARSS
jgi:hypothetical protein